MTKQSLSQISVSFNGTTFLLDVAEGQMMSLNAIYAAAGSPANKNSWAWFRNDDVAVFLLTMVSEQSAEFKPVAETYLTQRPEKKEKSKELGEWCRTAFDLAVKAKLVATKRGKYGGGTWAHWKIATKYAAYLEPAIESAILDVFRERVQEELDPDLALSRGRQRARVAWVRQGRTDDWIGQRIRTTDDWHLFTRTLQEHQVEKIGFSQCADSINKPILGGTSKQVKALRNVPMKGNLRDALDEEELAAINLAQVKARKAIKTNNLLGNQLCAKACLDAATKVASIL